MGGAADAAYEAPVAEIGRLDYRLVRDGPALEEILRLRHDAYVNEGALAPRACGTFRDDYDDLPHSLNFGIYIDGALSAAIRLGLLARDHRGSPTETAFPEEVGAMLDTGAVIVDPSRFVCSRAAGAILRRVSLYTLRIPFVAAGHFGAEYVLAAVRPEHRAFYRRMLRLQQISDPRPYPGLATKLVLMAVSYPEEHCAVLRRQPLFGARREQIVSALPSVGHISPRRKQAPVIPTLQRRLQCTPTS